jgi:CDP-glucose 4,6-dehydratase
MNKLFWKNKKILITGDTGFKGAWISLILSQAGAKIQGFSSSTFHGNAQLYESLKINKISNTIDGDIRDEQAIQKAFNDFQPECVFHLAAQPLVRDSYVNPVSTYDINVMGTINILEAIRSSNSVKAAVMVTTDKCYENKEWEWGYRENDPLGGHDPYSSSKACAELAIQSYQQSFFNDLRDGPGISSVRAGNVIGGGDFSKDRLIPDLYDAISKNQHLLLRNPFSTRPWQHVLEPISGYLKVAEKLYDSGSLGHDSWNFGPQVSDIRTVQEVSDLFCKSWGITNIIKHDIDKDQPHEAHSLSLDISKAFLKLNWYPKWSLETSIEETATWYKAYFEKKDVLNLTNEQIERYLSV